MSRRQWLVVAAMATGLGLVAAGISLVVQVLVDIERDHHG